MHQSLRAATKTISFVCVFLLCVVGSDASTFVHQDFRSTPKLVFEPVFEGWSTLVYFRSG